MLENKHLSTKMQSKTRAVTSLSAEFLRRLTQTLKRGTWRARKAANQTWRSRFTPEHYRTSRGRLFSSLAEPHTPGQDA